MKEKLMAILEEVRPDIEFEEETQLIDEGVLDSLDILTIVTAIGETFGVDIDIDDLEPENFNSVEAMLALIKKLQVK